MPYFPTGDNAVSATTATNFLAMEGTNNAGPATGMAGTQVTTSLATIGNSVLGGCNAGSLTSITGFGCTGSTYYIAGLAFDMHVRDIRPDLKSKASPVTVSTFWLDVMESNDYHQKNQYWLVGRDGGFDTTKYTYGSPNTPVSDQSQYCDQHESQSEQQRQ